MKTKALQQKTLLSVLSTFCTHLEHEQVVVRQVNHLGIMDLHLPHVCRQH